MAIQDGLNIKDEEIQSFLMIGQSNMAGRGTIGDVPPIDNKSCLMLRMGRWQKMSEPINPDRSIFEGSPRSGCCLAASFADEVAKATGGRVGLIPCADGGTKLASWMPGQVLYDHAVMMTKLAMRSSRLCGILWHQGESDCTQEERVRTYVDRFVEMITTMRRDLGMGDIPVIIGELSLLIDPKYNRSEYLGIMNENFAEIARRIPNCGVVSSDGLVLKADGLHFDAPSLRIFGKRYFEVYSNLTQNK
jgi:hypothetical protein